MLTPKLRLRQERNVPRVTERQIQESCSEYLALDGWRRIKTDMPQLRGLGVQEKGMADDMYVRYLAPEWPEEPEKKRWAEVLWCEWKRRTGKAMAHQMAWHQAERARGALTLIAGIDFVASIEGFQEWYRASGLARRGPLRVSHAAFDPEYPNESSRAYRDAFLAGAALERLSIDPAILSSLINVAIGHMWGAYEGGRIFAKLYWRLSKRTHRDIINGRAYLIGAYEKELEYLQKL